MLIRETATHPAAGFTLVELMVTVAVVAILAGIAAPAMRVFIENARIRATSESLQNGLSLARAEAVRLNRNIEFVREPSGWVVRVPGTIDPLHAASGRESGTGVDLSPAPAGADRITFDPFGRRIANANGSAALNQIDIESVSPPSSTMYRPLRVQIQATGAPRLCLPAAGAADPKACL